MEVTLGLVTGREIARNRDGLLPVRLLQVMITDERDVQTVQLLGQAGEECNPPAGTLVTMAAAGQAMKLAIATDDAVQPDLPVGGKRIYATNEDGDTLMAQVRLLPDGTVVVSNSAASFTMSPDGTFTFHGTATEFDHPVTAPVFHGTEDVTFAGKSAVGHTHGGVQTGSSNTGVPT